jgi:phage tail-like protein
MFYTVFIEGVPPLGGINEIPFVECTGLEMHYEEFQWKEGGNNGTIVRLPGRMVPGTVKLTHQVSEDSVGLMEWFIHTSQVMFQGIVVITLLANNHGDEPVANWTLTDAWPVRYCGPTLTLSPAGESVAVETIEIAHGGFTPGGIG